MIVVERDNRQCSIDTMLCYEVNSNRTPVSIRMLFSLSSLPINIKLIDDRKSCQSYQFFTCCVEIKKRFGALGRFSLYITAVSPLENLKRSTSGFLMLVFLLLPSFFLFTCLAQPNMNYDAFAQEDEAAYMNAFGTLIKDSYAAPLPEDLRTRCQNQNQAAGATSRTISNSMTSSDLQAFCGTDTICTVPTGLTVTMNSNLNVAALVISGSLIWSDNTQVANAQWLCAGYIAVSDL